MLFGTLETAAEERVGTRLHVIRDGAKTFIVRHQRRGRPSAWPYIDQLGLTKVGIHRLHLAVSSDISHLPIVRPFAAVHP